MPFLILTSRSWRGRVAALSLAVTFIGGAVASVAIAQAPATLAARTTALARDPMSIAQTVEAVGFTVSDMDRAVAFYSSVLTFEKLSDVEITGDAFERLEAPLVECGQPEWTFLLLQAGQRH